MGGSVSLRCAPVMFCHSFNTVPSLQLHLVSPPMRRGVEQESSDNSSEPLLHLQILTFCAASACFLDAPAAIQTDTSNETRQAVTRVQEFMCQSLCS